MPATSEDARMPVIGLGLHFIAAIFFAVHAIRSGQDRYWLYILFIFPILGSIVYAFAIWLPSLRQDPAARALARGVRARLDPGRELREAEDAFAHSATTAHRLRLADALSAAGRHADAVDAYRACLQGVHGDDPAIHVRLAGALLESGQPGEVIDVLDALIRQHPSLRSPDGHLLYARALVAAGQRERAREEFDALVTRYVGYEARARYADALRDWGEGDAARRLAEDSLRGARRLPRYARKANKAWIDRLARHVQDAPAAR
jgi:hypothetical protein